MPKVYFETILIKCKHGLFCWHQCDTKECILFIIINYYDGQGLDRRIHEDNTNQRIHENDTNQSRSQNVGWSKKWIQAMGKNEVL